MRKLHQHLLGSYKRTNKNLSTKLLKKSVTQYNRNKVNALENSFLLARLTVNKLAAAVVYLKAEVPKQ
jgi:hypothetical protein